MKKIILTLIFASIAKISFTQHGVDNPSFENGNYDQTKGIDYNFHKNISNWEGRTWIGEISSWHSPDWIYLGYPYSYHGDYKLGIWDYELVQQKLSNSNKLEDSKHYLIKLRFNINPTTSSNGCFLNLYLAKNKMKYKRESSSKKKEAQHYCSSDYKEFSSSWGQDIITLGSLNISGYDNQRDEWIEARFLYSPGDNQNISNYNWFGFQTTNNASSDECRRTYLYIDYISIEEVDYCSFDECSPTDGEIVASNPYFYYGDSRSIICVDNLSNVRELKNIRITFVNSQSPLYSLPDIYAINGIHHPICMATPNLASSSYFWRMTMINDCGEKEYKVQFVVDDITPSFDIPLFSPINNSALIPRSCCLEHQDIIINNQIFSGPGQIHYVAKGSISTIGNVIVNHDVTDFMLQAENEITLNPGFETSIGSNCVFQIDPCEQNLKNLRVVEKNDLLGDAINIVSNTTDIEVFSKKILLDIEDEVGNENAYVIYPNPFRNSFTVSCASISPKYSIVISNSIGSVVLHIDAVTAQNITVLLDGLPSGIYFVKIKDELNDCLYKLFKK